MNIALWVVQGLLAAAFFGAGAMKLATPREKLMAKASMAWAVDFSAGQIKLIGLAEVLGAIGLVVPWLAQIAPLLTPIAAAGLIVVMLGAARTHMQRKEPPVPALVFGALATFVAIGRTMQLV